MELNGASETMEVITGQSGSLDYTGRYDDINTATPSFGSAPFKGNITTATTTSIIAAPGAGVQRIVKFLSLCNRDAANNQTVSVQINNGAGGLYRAVTVVVLKPGEVLQYIDGQGFRVLDPFAQAKASVSATISNPPTKTGPWAVYDEDSEDVLGLVLAEMRVQNMILSAAFGLDIDLDKIRSEKELNPIE